jgi:hypothetical protein
MTSHRFAAALVVLTLLACGLRASAAPPPPAKSQPLPEKAIEAWKKAGASVGWVRAQSGDLRFRQLTPGEPSQTDEDLPAFRLNGWAKGALGKLPDPGVPFGLGLYGDAVTDAGLKELAGLKSLRALYVASDSVTDAGLKELAALKRVQGIDVSRTKVTAAGLKELAGLKLKSLDIPRSAQTDEGLKHYLAAIEPPTFLYLVEWNVTDPGLKELVGLAKTEHLYLSRTQVTDVGLKELAGLKNLRTLELQKTKVTDAGLKHLAGLKSLQSLHLDGTEVTDVGLKDLQKALPECQISR